MRRCMVLNGQTVFDIAMQHCGSVEAAFDIAAMNDIAVTSHLQPGAVALLPDIVAKTIVAFYKNHNISPATEMEMLGIEDFAVLKTVAGEDIVIRRDGMEENLVPLTPPTKTIADFETTGFERDDYLIAYDPVQQKEVKFKASNDDLITDWAPI